MAKTSETINKKLLAAAISATKARDIKDLLDKGADINAHNEWGLTPVMLAAQYNHSVAVLKALIEAGADIHEAEPKYRSNALHTQRSLRLFLMPVLTSMQETTLVRQH